MCALSNLYRRLVFSLLISICILLPLLTNNAAAITAAISSTDAKGITATTNYHQNSRSFEDAATAAAIAATAAMTAVALPVASATTTSKDYAQQLPRHYPPPATAITAAEHTQALSASNVATVPLYQNYFENTDNVNNVKIGTTDAIMRTQKQQWQMPTGSDRALTDGRVMTAAAAAEATGAMTVAGFTPTTLTAAGQHYIVGLSEEAPSADDAHAINDYATRVGGAKTRSGGGGERSMAVMSGTAAKGSSINYPKSKIDTYEINGNNYERNANDGVAALRSETGIKMSATDDAYQMLKYDMNSYAEQMQRALAENERDEVRHNEEASNDSAANQQGDGEGRAYFKNHLMGYENYFMPTYQIEQFSNYHNQPEEQAPMEQHYGAGRQQEQEERQEQRQDQQQQQQQQNEKSNRELHAQPQLQLRPLALYDDGVDNNAMLQHQFNNGANIENIEDIGNIGNYANDRQKLRYYGKQPQQQAQLQTREEQQQQQQERQLQTEQQVQLYLQQQLQLQLKQLQQARQYQQQQQQLKQQQEHQQQQQLQLTHQMREYPEMLRFSMPQPPPHSQPFSRPSAPAFIKVARPSDKTPLTAPRRHHPQHQHQHQQQHQQHQRQQQQHQLQQQQKRNAMSLQVTGNVARRSLLPTMRNFHIDTDSRIGSNRGSRSSKESSSDSRATTTTITTATANRSTNEKSGSSENIADHTNSPTQYHYTLTQTKHHTASTEPSSHVSAALLVGDSVNEIDDTTHTNSDDGDDDNITNSNLYDQNEYYVTTSHQIQQHPHPQPHQLHEQYIPLSRHVEVTRHIPVVTDYQRIHVPYNQSVPIQIPEPIITTIPRPYPIRVPVTKTVAVPKVHEVRIPVDKVKPYPVERPVPYVVERRVPYMVEKQVAKPIYYPYPIQVPIVKTIVHKLPRRHNNFGVGGGVGISQHQHSSSYPFGQYHLHQSLPHIGTHSLNGLHYTQTTHFG